LPLLARISSDSLVSTMQCRPTRKLPHLGRAPQALLTAAPLLWRSTLGNRAELMRGWWRDECHARAYLKQCIHHSFFCKPMQIHCTRSLCRRCGCTLC
jgi:hypothetical protein